MTHQLNGLEKAILIGAVRDLERLKRMRQPIYKDFRLRLAVEDAKVGGAVRCNAAEWLEQRIETAAQRMAVSRAYASLERRGLVDRIALGWAESRCSHLVLTANGRKLAKKLRTESAT